MSNSANKRKFPRVEAKGVAAYLRLNGHNAGCTVQNISVGGVFVRTDRFLPVGTKLAFDLVKPGMKKALTVHGWVVGVITPELAAKSKLPQGLRIQFAKMGATASEALQELVGSLRRNPNAEPPVLYPLEGKEAREGKEAKAAALAPPPPRRRSGPKRTPAPPPKAPASPPRSRSLADEPASSTEVEMEARRPAHEREADDEGDDTADLRHGRGGDQRMIDDSLIDSTGDRDEEEPSGEDQEEQDDRDDRDAPDDGAGSRGEERNPFDDEDQTIGVEPTRLKARYGEAVPGEEYDERQDGDEGAEDGDEGTEDAGDLEATNHELHRLLARREEEISALRTQVSKLEHSLKEKDEQLQMARRILKTNGLG